jgi:hypothetical protein
MMSRTNWGRRTFFVQMMGNVNATKEQHSRTVKEEEMEATS